MHNLTTQNALHLPSSPYIYALLHLPTLDEAHLYFAIITSADDLHIISADRRGPNDAITQTQQRIHDGVTCLTPLSSSPTRSDFLTAGRDGRVRFWVFDHDGLAPRKVLRTPGNAPISALASVAAEEGTAQSGWVAAGSEHADVGVGDVGVFVWSLANDGEMLVRTYSQSHSDTITSLAFLRPADGNDSGIRLLSGSTDGLVQCFDIAIEDEDEAVESAVNNGGPVNHFLPIASSAEKNQDAVLSISHDEKLGYYSLGEQTSSEEPQATMDVRERLDVDYVIDLRRMPQSRHKGENLLVLAGRNKNDEGPAFVIAALLRDVHGGGSEEVLLRLEGGHGEEVVRDLWINDGVWMDEKARPAAVSVGEDGAVRLWDIGGGDDTKMEGVEGDEDRVETKGTLKKRRGPNFGGPARFAPY